MARWFGRVKGSLPPQPPPLLPAAEPARIWRWKLTDELSALPDFNAQVQAHLDDARPQPDAATRSAVMLILDEMLTNVIKYAHPDGAPGGRLIDVQLRIGDGDIGIEIEDDGVPFDPTAGSGRSDADVPLEERQIGGWGLSLVRKTAGHDDLRACWWA